MDSISTLQANRDMSNAAKANECQKWLDANPNHDNVGLVQSMKSMFKDMERKDEEFDEELKRKDEEFDEELKRKDEEFDEELKRKDEELKRKDDTIRGQDNELKRKDEELERKDDTIREQDNTIYERSLKRLKRSFPFLIDRTLSVPHYPIKHSPCEPITAVVNTEMDMKKLFDGFWDAPFVEGSRNCDSEAAPQHFVVDILQSVIRGMKLDGLVEIVQHRTLAGVECDIVLIYTRNRLPFAAVEVKKPGNSKEGRQLVWTGKEGDGNRVAGQHRDQLKAIQLFGFSSVTGMITTGNHWKIVGLSGEPRHEKSTYTIDSPSVFNTFGDFLGMHVTEKAEDSQNETNTGQANSPCEKALKLSLKQSQTNGTNEKKNFVWAGGIVPDLNDNMSSAEIRDEVEASGERIVKQVVFFVAQACSNLYELLQRNPGASVDSNDLILKGKMPCRILTNRCKDDRKNKENVFAFGTLVLNKLKLDSFCDPAGKLYVFRHLGMGEYGNVCLASSDTGGSCCAIKFYHDPSKREEYAMEELKNWKLVYEEEADLPAPYILETGVDTCFVMPYLHPISDTRRQELLNDGTIRKVLEQFLSRGVIHTDIKWRHFRLRTVGSSRRARARFACSQNTEQAQNVYLVDLGQGSLHGHNHDKDKNETWIQESISKLQGSI